MNICKYVPGVSATSAPSGCRKGAMCTYIFTYVYLHLNLHIYIRMYTHTCIHIYMNICKYVPGVSATSAPSGCRKGALQTTDVSMSM